MYKYEQLLKGITEQGLYPDFKIIESGVNEPHCIVNGVEHLLFCANNYLSLTESDVVKEAAVKSINQYGVGPGGSRVISGDVKIIRDLEKEIAELTGTEDCITFPTGYMANVSVFSAIMGFLDELVTDFGGKKKGIIFSDEYNHGSIVDGCKLSSAKIVIFKHNDLDDLQKKVSKYPDATKLIVTESVFSLEGEIIDIRKYIEIAKSTSSLLMIDDAHGIGLLGEEGGGIAEYYNCAGDIDILMGCMDKAFGGTGGYLCGGKKMVDFLRIATRASLLSSAIPTMMAGAMIQSAHEIRRYKDQRKDLFKKSESLRRKISEGGFKILGDHNIPAIAVSIGNDNLGIKFEKMLSDEKIICPIIRWPAVRRNTSRFRIIVMLNHSEEDISRFANVFIKIGKTLKIVQ